MDVFPEMCLLESLLVPEESDSEQSSESESPVQKSPTLTEEVVAAVNSLFAICGTFPAADNATLHPIKLSSDQLDSETALPCVLSALHRLSSVLKSLQTHAHSLSQQLQSAHSATSLLQQLLKSKEELLDSVSEELYLTLADRNLTLIPDNEGGRMPFEVLVEEGDGEEKGLESVLKGEEIRRKQALLEAFGKWKGEIGQLQVGNTLEGAHKQAILRKNPLLSSMRTYTETLLPPPVLFNQLFAFLDQCFAQLKANSAFNPADFCAKGGLQRQFTHSTGVILQSLQAYYEEDSMIAGLFARILNIIDSDPLLLAPNREIVRLNAELKAITQCKVLMRDQEAGGFIAVKDTLSFIFSLQLSKEERLVSHLLEVLKPEEMTAVDWAKYVLYHFSPVQKGPLASLLQGKLAVLKTFLGNYLPENVDLEGMDSFDAVSKLLVVGRGELLAYFLQVYDLSVDQLYVHVDNQAQEQCLSLAGLQTVLGSLKTDCHSALLSSVWEAAQAFCPLSRTDIVHKDAALLAIITSDQAEIAAKPLTSIVRKEVRKHSLAIRTEITEESEEMQTCYATTLASGLGGKGRALFTPRGRESVRSKRRTQSIFF
jgi:hypothetical protein